MMDGRLKTLHPMIHGGILCRRDNSTDMAAVAEFGIKTFELVVVNLYPFEQTVAARMSRRARRSRTSTSAGRPWSGRREESPVHDNRDRRRPIFRDPPGDLPNGCTSLELPEKARRRGLRPHGPIRRGDRRVLRRPEGRGRRSRASCPRPHAHRRAPLRRKSPPAGSGVYAAANAPAASLVSAMRLNGKELSYNNLLDLDSAQRSSATFRAGGLRDQAQQPLRSTVRRPPLPKPWKKVAGRSAQRARIGPGAEPRGRRGRGRTAR